MSQQNNKYQNFDPEKLFALKNDNFGYKYCPRCRSELVRRDIDYHTRLVCTGDSCEFIYYHNPVPAAGVVLVEDDRILLVKRAHPPRIGDWCIPAGFMEWHEHPSQTAVRETEEETGLRVNLIEFFEVYSGTDDPRSNAVLMLYRGERIGGELQAGDDAQDVRFFSFDEIPANIAFESHQRAIADYTRRFRRHGGDDTS